MGKRARERETDGQTHTYKHDDTIWACGVRELPLSRGGCALFHEASLGVLPVLCSGEIPDRQQGSVSVHSCLLSVGRRGGVPAPPPSREELEGAWSLRLPLAPVV